MKCFFHSFMAKYYKCYTIATFMYEMKPIETRLICLKLIYCILNKDTVISIDWIQKCLR